MLLEVVRAEGPVSKELALRRVRSAWGKGRAGDRIRNAVDAAILELRRRNQLVIVDEKFLGTSDAVATSVRSPFGDPDAIRSVEDIPPSELDAAASSLVQDAIRVNRDELTSSLAGVFGWARRGPEISEALTASVDRLIAKGVLVEVAGSLSSTPTA